MHDAELRIVAAAGSSTGDPALARECRQIAAEAERLAYQTRSHLLEALPGMARDRAALLEISARAAAFASSLEELSPPSRRASLRPPSR